MITNRHGGSPGGDENVLKLNRVCGGITLNILKTTKLNTFKGYILWYVNCISNNKYNSYKE